MVHRYNLYAPETFANPYPLYERLRAEDPVHWLEPWGPWVVSRYGDVVAALRDPRLSSALDVEDTSALLPVLTESERTVFRYRTLAVVYTDPPRHTRIRAAMKAAFVPCVEAIRPRAQAIADELIDAVWHTGHMDVVHDFAFSFPALVMAEMLGVTRTDLHQPIERRPSDGATLDLLDYFRALIAERRACPGDDLISALIAVGRRGDGLSEDELLAACVQFLFAGRESTPHVIANGLLALLQHPDQLDQLRGDPSLMSVAVEELLRYDGAALIHPRVATEDLEIGGRRIRTGHRVFLLLGSANRDPDAFPDPDCLNIMRRTNHHVALGYGPHLCLGAPLARLEARIAFATLLRRLPRLRLAMEALEWRTDTEFRYLRSLPVVFDTTPTAPVAVDRAAGT